MKKTRNAGETRNAGGAEAPSLPPTKWAGVFKMCQTGSVDTVEHKRQDNMLDSLEPDGTLDYSLVTYSNAKLYGIIPVFLPEVPVQGQPIMFIGMNDNVAELAERIPKMLRNYLTHAWKQVPTLDEHRQYRSARNLARLFIKEGAECPKALKVWYGKTHHMPVYPDAPPPISEELTASLRISHFPH